MHTGTEVEDTKAVRSGNKNSITKMTMMMASIKSFKKERTDLLTTSGWSVMRCTLMSGGAVAKKASITLLTCSPNSTMLLPERISMENIRQLLLLALASEYCMYCEVS